MDAQAKVTAGELLEQLLAGLDRLDDDRSGLSASVRLEWLRLARQARSRVDGLCSVLAAEAERAQAAEAETGSPLRTWLGRTEVLSRSEASGVVHQARAVGEHPAVGAAAVAGRVNTAQVRAITRLLSELGPSLSEPQLEQAEGLLVGWAGRMDAKQLEGLLPRLEGQAWIALINAHAEAARRTAIEARDPLAAQPSIEQRRADALISLIRAAGAAKPAFGAGAARVIVHLDYEKLVGRAGAARFGGRGAGGGATREGAAGQRATGQAGSSSGAAQVGGCELSVGELRRLCCEAELIPVVLGGASEVLDVGRASRLVTPAIRTALVARDGGCVFPGCGLPPDACEAHHVVPWWAGGVSALTNFVLLCHSHHALVEPARHSTRDQWEVRVARDGVPEFLPPRRLDAGRTPVRHCRHAPALTDTG